MDTRSRKSKSGKFKVNIILVLILLVASIAMVSSYPNINKTSLIDKSKVGTEEFANYISELMYPIYYDMKKETGEMSDPSAFILDDKKLDELSKDYEISDDLYYHNDENYVEKYEEYMNKEKSSKMTEEERTAVEKYLIKGSISSLMGDIVKSDTLENNGYNVLSIDSYNKNNKKSSSTNNEIEKFRELILNEKKTNEEENKLYEYQEGYVFYVVLDFDQSGNLKIPYIKGMSADTLKEVIDKKQNKNNISVLALEKKYTGEEYTTNLPKVKNAIFTIALKDDVNILAANLGPYGVGDGTHLSSILTNNIGKSIVGTMMIGLIICGILFAAGLLIPRKISENIVLVKKFINIPIELAIYIGFMISGILIEIAANPVLVASPYDISAWMNIRGISEEVISAGIMIVNLVYWFVLFMFCIIAGAYLRSLFSKDNREQVKKKSIIVKLIRWTIRQIKMFVHWIENLDLKKGLDKPLLIIVGINLLCITIMCIFWGLGIIIAIIYSILLFRFMKSKATSVHRDYLRLEEMTENIADGNFNMDTKEDLGIFNPIKENLGNIQTGFKRAVDEEVKSQRMKTELITNVSHDLKTPLTSIITYVDLLKKEGITDEEKAKYIDVIDRKSQRLKYLIEDLFEVSRSTSGNIELNPVDVDVVSLVKQTVFELDDKIAASGVEIRTRFSNEKIIARLDSMRTFRIFSNLISNISKYSMYGSRAYIEVEDMGDKVSIEFKNISAEEIDGDVENLSERFVRGDKSRNTEGSGLGLAIAKSFTELQGGTFKLSSDGDLFKVRVVFPKKSTIENNTK